ncbi:hypothetical protein [Nitrosopumilus ureiphilus]|uniref:Uncharacterized protein n=1 Tax=Nitrosopumilus ureiphilus TaxID=1470067 RepID=A0A7D5M5U8_9ARCH|nr:hypothetical protein [Nitrosopumilus ureiphilus]QLH07193.1 hypothetical protein C5F50_08955 [Nitrosopumilus ureiphilus]
MSQVENQYNEFLSSIGQLITNVDVNLMMKIMYLERKLPDVDPRVELYIDYKSGVDPMKKQEQMRGKYGFPTQTSIQGLTAVGRMNIDLIEEISKDQDIEHISGSATPASY